MEQDLSRVKTIFFNETLNKTEYFIPRLTSNVICSHQYNCQSPDVSKQRRQTVTLRHACCCIYESRYESTYFKIRSINIKKQIVSREAKSK